MHLPPCPDWFTAGRLMQFVCAAYPAVTRLVQTLQTYISAAHTLACLLCTRLTATAHRTALQDRASCLVACMCLSSSTTTHITPLIRIATGAQSTWEKIGVTELLADAAAYADVSTADSTIMPSHSTHPMKLQLPKCRFWYAESLAALSVQVYEGRVVEGDPSVCGHVISTTASSGLNRSTINYSTERVVGNGSFGVVFQATCLETGETVHNLSYSLAS